MPSRPSPLPSLPVCVIRPVPRRSAAVLGIGLLMMSISPLPSARSATVPDATPSSNSASAPLTPGERLQRLVPQRMGGWRRASIGERLPRRQAGNPSVTIDAEFVSGGRTVLISVSDAGSATPYSGKPMRTKTDEGHEATYHEGRATVMEKWRRIDGHAELTLLRDDGIVVIAVGDGVPMTELKRLAQAIKPRRAG